MNDTVLFYLQPHTIRNNAKTFEWIFEKYLELAQGLKARGIQSLFMVDDHIKEKYRHSDHSIYAPADFGIQFDTSRWPAYWYEILVDPAIPEKKQLLEALYQKQPFRWVFCWGYDATLDRFCKEQGCTLIFQELGMIRRPMLYQMDLTGLLWKSSLAHLFKKYGPQIKTDHERLDRFLSSMRKRPTADREEIVRGLRLNADKPILLILLQVEDDSNIVVGSPFGTMQEYLDYCFSKILDIEEYNVIIRKHPGQPQVAISLESYQKPGAKPWLVSHEYDNLSLIQAADYVFVINSSAGFEGLCYGKKVVTFGQSPYHEAGFTLNLDKNRAYSLRAAAAFFDGLFEEKREELDAFLYFSLFHYHFPEHLMFLPEYYASLLQHLKETKDKESLFLRKQDDSPAVLKAVVEYYSDRMDRDDNDSMKKNIYIRELENKLENHAREIGKLESALQQSMAEVRNFQQVMDNSLVWKLAKRLKTMFPESSRRKKAIKWLLGGSEKRRSE